MRNTDQMKEEFEFLAESRCYDLTPATYANRDTELAWNWYLEGRRKERKLACLRPEYQRDEVDAGKKKGPPITRPATAE